MQGILHNNLGVQPEKMFQEPLAYITKANTKP